MKPACRPVPLVATDSTRRKDERPLPLGGRIRKLALERVRQHHAPMTIRKIGQMSLAHVNEMPLKWLAQTVRVAVEADAAPTCASSLSRRASSRRSRAGRRAPARAAQLPDTREHDDR